jgi:hypothetical protein
VDKKVAAEYLKEKGFPELIGEGKLERAQK